MCINCKKWVGFQIGRFFVTKSSGRTEENVVTLLQPDTALNKMICFPLAQITPCCLVTIVGDFFQ
jgi:hypothetical protein